MFFLYSLITTAIPIVIAFLVVLILRQPLNHVLRRITSEENNKIWTIFINFAVLAASLSNGVSLSETDIRQLQDGFYEFNFFWLKLYVIIIDSIRGIFYALAYVFIALATAFVIIGVAEIIKNRREEL